MPYTEVENISIRQTTTANATAGIISTVVSPGAVTVQKSREDILVHCTKSGWQDASATIPSDFQGWTLGNLVIGGLIGVGVDAASGAMNEYPNAYQIPMVPLTQANNGNMATSAQTQSNEKPSS